MNIYQTQLEEQVFKVIEPTLQDLGYEAIRIRFMGAARKKTLQIMIDRLDGKSVTIKDCEVSSRQISVLLDVEDTIKTQYTLELSSPGIDRPLTREKDYVSSIDKNIKLSTKFAINGRRNFRGTIQSINDTGILLLPNDSEQAVQIAFANISDANLQLDLELKQEKRNINRRRK